MTEEQVLYKKWIRIKSRLLQNGLLLYLIILFYKVIYYIYMFWLDVNAFKDIYITFRMWRDKRKRLSNLPSFIQFPKLKNTYKRRF